MHQNICNFLLKPDILILGANFMWAFTSQLYMSKAGYKVPQNNNYLHPTKAEGAMTARKEYTEAGSYLTSQCFHNIHCTYRKE